MKTREEEHSVRGVVAHNGCKVSKYNFFFHFKEEGEYLIYNSISNGLAKVNKDIYEVLKKGGNGLEELINKPDNKELMESLRAGHILIDKDFDEIEFLRVKLNLTRFGLKTLALTIVPTLDCNLKCIYCYEGIRSKKYMDKDTEEALIDFATAWLRRPKRRAAYIAVVRSGLSNVNAPAR